MTVTIILTSHMKPTLRDALASVDLQTRRDFECIVMDSGQWIGLDDDISKEMARIAYEWMGRPGFEWYWTNEPPNLRDVRCPVGWATNETIRRGYVRGRYVCTFYDDDRYDPRFIEMMAGYLDEHPDEMAVWCSQDRIVLHRDGNESPNGRISAGHVLTPGMLDCRVDGGQVMFRREALDRIGDPWLPEEPNLCGHSDGVFLEKLATVAGQINPLPEVLMAHRHTPYSTYSPS